MKCFYCRFTITTTGRSYPTWWDFSTLILFPVFVLKFANWENLNVQYAIYIIFLNPCFCDLRFAWGEYLNLLKFSLSRQLDFPRISIMTKVAWHFWHVKIVYFDWTNAGVARAGVCSNKSRWIFFSISLKFTSKYNFIQNNCKILHIYIFGLF